MNRRQVSLALLSAALLGNRSATGADPVSQARPSASEWLGKLDAADYPATWAAAAGIFKAAITAQAWSQAAQAARAPLGLLRSRTEKSANFTHTLPGAPDGEYLVFQFNSVFENKAQAVETVTAKREPDGTWRIAGYFIR
jgi:hypothetical protein